MSAHSLWADAPVWQVGSVTQPNILPIFLKGEDLYQLASEWSVEVMLSDHWWLDEALWGVTVNITLPAGYVFDGASVPRPLWWLFPPDGLYRPGTTVHDWIYNHMGNILVAERWTDEYSGRPFRVCLSRKDADQILLDVMLRAGVKKWKAHTITNAVRLFGGAAWNKVRPVRVLPLVYDFSHNGP